ncbi:rhamnose binding lectin type Ia-like [Scleropages formosus]|uniref:Rhamnose binding lectin type Ia-like n=1 Tax=Scleropages formosus TaxID=113540 RepID=A0A0P7TTW0_SCLFO|nr:rhamnose binding lectin type Ia-like [Scleropages formosus]
MNRCNGKRVCELSVSPAFLSDPCADGIKYLNTSYTCLPVKGSVSCEHSVSELNCGAVPSVCNLFSSFIKNEASDQLHFVFHTGTDVIKVFYATYGRRDGTTCSAGHDPHKVANVNCFLNCTQMLSIRCDGKTRCSVSATNSAFPDPCVGTKKYLEVFYGCFPAISGVYAFADVGCVFTGKDLIMVYDANYGRSNSTVCSAGRPDSQTTTTNCFLPGAFKVMSEKCNDRSKCEVMASNSVFTDPCYGTYKYLEVSYGCLPASKCGIFTVHFSAVFKCNWIWFRFIYFSLRLAILLQLLDSEDILPCLGTTAGGK